MITMCRNTERRRIQRGQQQIWQTVYPQGPADPHPNGFGALTLFEEVRLLPGGRIAPHHREEAEIFTYVHRGALAQEDSTGFSGLIRAGEFQRMSTGRGIRHKETNASQTEWAHLFRLSLHPAEAGLESAHELKRFTVAQRHNIRCVVASPDGQKGSLHIHQRALIYSSILDSGYHLVHEILRRHRVWLHILSGSATLNTIVLTQGDCVGFEDELSVSLTGLEDTEILMTDLSPAPSAFNGGVRP